MGIPLTPVELPADAAVGAATATSGMGAIAGPFGAAIQVGMALRARHKARKAERAGKLADKANRQVVEIQRRSVLRKQIRAHMLNDASIVSSATASGTRGSSRDVGAQVATSALAGEASSTQQDVAFFSDVANQYSKDSSKLATGAQQSVNMGTAIAGELRGEVGQQNVAIARSIGSKLFGEDSSLFGGSA